MTIHSPSLKAPGFGALDRTLVAATRRIRSLLLLRFGSRALCFSALFCLLLVGAGKLRLIETPDPRLCGAIIGVSLIVAAIMALTRPLKTLDVARLTERRADLKERLSSAMEFRSQEVDPSQPFYGEQFSDAERHATAVNVRALYPVRLPRELIFGLLASLGLFLLYYLPTLPAFWSPQQKKDADQVQKQGIVITKLAKDTEKSAEQQKLEETKKASAEMKKLGEAMRKNKLNKKQALVEMQKLTKRITDSQQKLAEKMPAKSMDQARGEFKKSLEKMQKDAEQARADKAAQKVDPKQLEKKSEAMKQAEDALKKMDEAMAAQQNKDMQSAMEQMAQQMQSGQMSQQEMQQMQQAMQQLSKAMQNSAMDEAAKKLDQLAKQMQQQMSKMDQKTLQELANQMQKIGQCMGSGQCKNMAQMDAESLQKLLDALKDGKMQMGMGKMPGQLPGQMPGQMPGMSRSQMQSMMRGDGSGKGGSGAGNGSGPDEMTKYLSKISKNPPNTKVTGKRSGVSQDVTITMKGNPGATKGAAPYYQVYQSSRKAAESTLDKENIPAAYKEQVRDYFNSIRP